jgi:hypothetical protein
MKLAWRLWETSKGLARRSFSQRIPVSLVQKALTRFLTKSTLVKKSKFLFLKTFLDACMKNVYEVLGQKELEVSRLQKEVEALRVAAPLLSEDGEAENDSQPPLPRAVNDTPQPDHSGWQDRAKKHWP